jgi:large subunit ribosomal protein L10
MALALEAKKTIVEEVHKVASDAYSVIGAEYSGIPVQKMTELRNKARSAGVHLRVVRNTLARRAVENTNLECIKNELAGQLVLAFSSEEPGSAAKVISDFGKDNKALKVKIVAISGQLLEVSDIDRLAKMPTYDQSISMLMAVMLAPVEKLARTLNEPHAKLVRTFAALKDKKEQE